MTQDNKDAALDLANELGLLKQDADIPEVMFVEKNSLPAYYNAARKPLEEEKEKYREDFTRSVYEHEKCKHYADYLYQQLLATQEAYQRVVEALKESTEQIKAYDDCVGAGWVNILVQDNEQALANPPSLEAVERKKLEDEIVVLGTAKEAFRPKHKKDYRLAYHVQCDIDSMIAERKAKLEKMK